jgi:hypothetical protein
MVSNLATTFYLHPRVNNCFIFLHQNLIQPQLFSNFVVTVDTTNALEKHQPKKINIAFALLVILSSVVLCFNLLCKNALNFGSWQLRASLSP